MKSKEILSNIKRQKYEKPDAEIIHLRAESIFTDSAGDNLGEWDPQLLGFDIN